MSGSTARSVQKSPWRRLRARWRLALRGRYALGAIFAGSVVESSLLPWPIEFPLLAYMLRGRPETVAVTVVVTLGSVTGCCLAFLAGAAALEAAMGFITERPALASSFEAAQTRIATYGPGAVVIAMMTPVPVQVSAFAAGASGLNPSAFVAAALIGRAIRYGSMGLLVYLYGPSILRWWARRPRGLRRSARWLVMFAFVAVFGWTLAAVFVPG